MHSSRLIKFLTAEGDIEEKSTVDGVFARVHPFRFYILH